MAYLDAAPAGGEETLLAQWTPDSRFEISTIHFYVRYVRYISLVGFQRRLKFQLSISM